MECALPRWLCATRHDVQFLFFEWRLDPCWDICSITRNLLWRHRTIVVDCRGSYQCHFTGYRPKAIKFTSHECKSWAARYRSDLRLRWHVYHREVCGTWLSTDTRRYWCVLKQQLLFSGVISRIASCSRRVAKAELPPQAWGVCKGSEPDWYLVTASSWRARPHQR